MKFRWDPAKALDNLRKHGVSFEEASTSFDDPRGVYLPDKNHNERGNLIAQSASSRVLFVVHVELLAEDPPAIRIISARKASKRQRNTYAHPDRT